ncbi:acetylserotonin O-methyltransferase-like [Rhododendron vialii]|uniref:acetylserotonin O-methyltransferase-like n=1 Tax=Rhododendron vialii TaxID=182163 RepID=UPI00265F333E|nr:acetylserotonin O-methyltransferase-like [Rhododendron vialii]
MEKGTIREDEEAQAHVDIWKYVFGFVDMAVVKCAIQLGIPDALEAHGGPATLSDLSSALGCSPSALHRIMRFLVFRNILKEGPAGYLQTPLSRLLMKNNDKSMADFVLFEASPAMLAPWHALSAHARANGAPAFELAHGEDIWKFAAEHPADRNLIDRAMACDARVAVPAIIEGCPELFDGLESVVDVGGGTGTVLRMLLKAFPGVRRGINFDLPAVVSAAPDCAGIERVGGDMFASVPKADAAYIMWVLHNWDDDECIQILSNCRKAIPKDKGKLIIIEAVIEEDPNNKLEFVKLMLDMAMMVHTNTGKERTAKEWAYILTQAGFSRHTIKPIKAVQSVIEAYP